MACTVEFVIRIYHHHHQGFIQSVETSDYNKLLYLKYCYLFFIVFFWVPSSSAAMVIMGVENVLATLRTPVQNASSVWIRRCSEHTATQVCNTITIYVCSNA